RGAWRVDASATGSCAAVGSSGSAPAIASRISRQSPAERASGPILSNVHEPTMPPARLTRPYVGRSPVMPQNAEGQRIEPQVSVPIAKPTSPAATAAPEPDDEPPVQRSRFHGLRPGPLAEAWGKR